MDHAIETVHVRTATPIRMVLLLALAIRIALPLLSFALTQNPKVFHASDTELYLNPALSLVQTGSFLTSPDNPTPEITRPPGYPVFLLPAILVGKVELLTISMQILLSCLTVYLVYRIALLLFVKNSVAVLCALLYAIEPMSVIFTSLLMTETLFTTILTASLFFLLKYLERGALADLTGCRPCNGRICFCPTGFDTFASMVRPAAAYCRLDQKNKQSQGSKLFVCFHGGFYDADLHLAGPKQN